MIRPLRRLFRCRRYYQAANLLALNDPALKRYAEPLRNQ